MAKFFDHIDEKTQDFIEKQHVFFVATAPLSAEGHVNVSPKGMDSLRVLGKNRVGYMDMTGSGNETSAHIAENERITFMFCAFKGSPDIVRLYGKGRTILPDSPEWDDISKNFTLELGTRQIIVADIHKVQTSCGYAVPFFEYQGERETLTKYWEAKGEEAVQDYWCEKNNASIDGLKAPVAEQFEK